MFASFVLFVVRRTPKIGQSLVFVVTTKRKAGYLASARSPPLVLGKPVQKNETE